MNAMYETYDGQPCNGGETSLTTRQSGPLGPTGAGPRTVGELERALLDAYPAADAERWDRTGLSVGDPSAELTGVACALDPTPAALEEAARRGANVLLTHHPVFIDAPEAFKPVGAGAPFAGATVFEAARTGVACMNFHTALDVSAAAQDVLPGMLRLERTSVLQPLARDARRGYGQVCVPAQGEDRLTLDGLAARCLAVFGRPPRVWGEGGRALERIVTWTGSAGSAPSDCLAQGVDALVCGEVKYHDALAAAESGLCLVELGHDVSELPFAALLAESVARTGIAREKITVIDQRDAWRHPEARRA